MSDGFAYIDILFFAMVAAFIAYRLRSVLGRRTGLERQPNKGRDRDAALRPAESKRETENSAPLPDGNGRLLDRPPPLPDPLPEAAVGSSASEGVAAIGAVDRSFTPGSFLPGAKYAFGMIVDAFAKGDLATLRPLLADQVYTNFKTVIEQRDRADERLETEITAEPAAEIVDAALLGRLAHVTVRFVSQQVNVTRDAQGGIISGDPSRPEEVIDLWTFERNVHSSDPNWLLSETATPE